MTTWPVSWPTPGSHREKVDETFTFSGRMPPNAGESQRHMLKIQTNCPAYEDVPSSRDAPVGAP